LVACRRRAESIPSMSKADAFLFFRALGVAAGGVQLVSGRRRLVFTPGPLRHDSIWPKNVIGAIWRDHRALSKPSAQRGRLWFRIASDDIPAPIGLTKTQTEARTSGVHCPCNRDFALHTGRRFVRQPTSSRPLPRDGARSSRTSASSMSMKCKGYRKA